MKCLIKRTGALGDVLLTTPIVKRLAQEGNQVSVWTRCPDVFKSNPYISPVDMAKDPEVKFFDLDLAYEKKPKCHIIDAYSEVVFGDKNTEHKIELFPHVPNEICRHRTFIVNPAVSWENRTFSLRFWRTVAKELRNLNIDDVYTLSGPGDYIVDGIVGVTPVKIKNLREAQLEIGNGGIFVGPDSGLLHVAQTTDTPCIGLFTCAKPEYRITSPKCYPIVPDIECHGCLHEAEPPVTYIGCKRGDLKCLDLITPEMVVEKAKEILKVDG